MNEAIYMHVFQSLRKLLRDCGRQRLRKGGQAVYVLLEVTVLDELHCQIQVIFVLVPALELDEVVAILDGHVSTTHMR